MTKNYYLRALCMAFGITGLALAGGQPAQAAEPFTISSSAFKDGGMLQVKNAGNIKKNPNCVGDNVSPPLAWKNAPGPVPRLAASTVPGTSRSATRLRSASRSALSKAVSPVTA